MEGHRQTSGTEESAHLGLVDGIAKGGGGGSHDDPLRFELTELLEVHELMVEREDITALRQGPQTRLAGCAADHDIGAGLRSAIVRRIGQHGHGDPQRTRVFKHHAGELTGTDDADPHRGTSATRGGIGRLFTA